MVFVNNNKDELYALLDLQKDTHVFIGDRNALIRYVASEINYDKKNRASFHTAIRQKNSIFSLQNLTGNDVSHSYYTQTRVIKPDPDDKTTWYATYDTICHTAKKPYIFHTQNGKIFDIRLLIDDIEKYLINNEQNNRYQYVYRSQRPFPRINTHTYVKCRRRLNIREYKTKITCEEQGVTYRKKALPHSDDPWCDFSFCRKSSGWKNKKNKKQWCHKNKKKNIAPGRHYFKDLTLLEEYDVLEQMQNEQCTIFYMPTSKEKKQAV